MNLLSGLFLLVAVGGLVHHGLQMHSPEAMTSLLLLSFSAWYLESKALARKSVDFSCGFVFLIALLNLGDAIGAWLCLLGCYGCRFYKAKTHLADLNSTIAPLLLGTILQMTENWPTTPLYRLPLGLFFVGLCQLFLFVVPRSSHSEGSDSTIARLEDGELAVLRLMVSSFCLLGGAIPIKQGWALCLALPLFLLVQKAAENTGYRVRALRAEKAKAKASQVQDRFKKTKVNLEIATQKKQIMEDINKAFARARSPEEGFKELGRLISQVLPFRSIALVQLTSSFPTVKYYLSPLKIKDPRVHEPLVLRAFQSQGVRHGKASKRAEERLFPEENHLIVLPVYPVGVLYLGREGDTAFSKTEATRLKFLVHRALPSILKLTEKAQISKALDAQSSISRHLKQQVSLSAKLLEAARYLLNSLTQEQTLQTFETVLTHSIDHQAAVVLLGEGGEPAWSWGHIDPSGNVEELRIESELLVQDNLQATSLGSLFPDCEILVSAPIQGESGPLGSVLLGVAEAQRPTSEQLDFLATCSCLVGSSLNSLQLSHRIKDTQERLSQASKMSAIGQLAASVAHELNTPLATISLAVQAAKQYPKKAEKRLNKAQDAVSKAQHIVSQLLEHSRHGDGKRKLLAPDQLLARAGELTAKELEKRRLELKINCEKMTEQIFANPTDIEQVLTNLILNAADASSPGHEVWVDARKVGTQIELSVQDQGSGIPAEDMEKIFKAFYTTKPPGEGTGLGLSVCRQLVTRHAGKVSLESELGEGSKFVLSFPGRLEKDVSFDGDK